MGKANRYKQLFSFTLILGIGTVISKLMTYVVLTPLYTAYLTPDEFGIVELVVQTANMLMPLVSLGINQSVLRFGMDGETDRGQVLTTGLAINLLGFATFLACSINLCFCFLSALSHIWDFTTLLLPFG